MDGQARAVRCDAAIYAVGAVVAGVAALSDRIPIQRQWGRIAFIPYVVVAGLAALWPRRTRFGLMGVRAAILALAIGGAALLPLGLEVWWRAHQGFAGHVQSEVLVTEESARALLHGRDPYAASFASGPLGAWPPGTAEHVPYLPGMFAFGLPRALAGSGAATDARLAFAGVALLVLAVALPRSGAARSKQLTALAAIVVLPTGARYMTGGGDDLAVLSLMLLSLVLLDRRRPGWAGVVAGLAAVTKQTAWPLLPFLVLAARDRDERPARGRALTAMSGVIVPVVLPFLVWNPRAFVEDVLLFPFGLAKDPTLAASPTLGRLIAEALPVGKGVVAAVLVLVVLAVAGYLAFVRPPTAARGAAERAAIISFLAIALATAGRFGYLLYPIGLFAWAHLILPPDPPMASVAGRPDRGSRALRRKLSDVVHRTLLAEAGSTAAICHGKAA